MATKCYIYINGNTTCSKSTKYICQLHIYSTNINDAKRDFGHSKTWVLNDQNMVYKDFITGIPSKGLFTI